MRTRTFVYLFILGLFSCVENQEPSTTKISNFGGITSTDNTGNLTGETDSTDWSEFVETWNQDELDLFGYLNPNQACFVSDYGTILAYPNPSPNYVYLKIKNPGLKFSFRLVDKHHNILMSGDSLTPPDNSTLMVNLNNLSSQPDTFRIYYSFFVGIVGCTMTHHGDIVKQ
jgi:hypothetical protein